MIKAPNILNSVLNIGLQKNLVYKKRTPILIFVHSSVYLKKVLQVLKRKYSKSERCMLSWNLYIYCGVGRMVSREYYMGETSSHMVWHLCPRIWNQGPLANVVIKLDF